MFVPQELRDRQQWLVWRYGKDKKNPEKEKLLKVPYYATGRYSFEDLRHGKQGDDQDRARLVSWGRAYLLLALSDAGAANGDAPCGITERGP